jgi:hypothetical protein
VILKDVENLESHQFADNPHAPFVPKPQRLPDREYLAIPRKRQNLHLL